MTNKTDLNKTTKWLKNNDVRFEVHNDGVHALDAISISQGTRVSLPALAEVSGSVNVYDGATFTADALAEVSVSVYVYDGATFTADALAEVSGSVNVYDGATFTAKALRTIGHLSYETTIFGHEVKVYDGIGTVTVSAKTRDEMTIRRCRKAQFENGELIGEKMYVVSRGDHNSHGETLKSAIADLAFKTADRDISIYRGMPTDTSNSPEDWAVIYRVITGACRMGVEGFMKDHSRVKEEYTLSEIIEATRGAYGSEQFRKAGA